MMSMAGDSLAGALPDPLSMMVRIMSTEAGANSLGAEKRPAVGSFDIEIMTDTSGTVIVVASKATGTATNYTTPGSPAEV